MSDTQIELIIDKAIKNNNDKLNQSFGKISKSLMLKIDKIMGNMETVQKEVKEFEKKITNQLKNKGSSNSEDGDNISNSDIEKLNKDFEEFRREVSDLRKML